MITFQNINTQHIFILPDNKAIEIINQAPDIYKVISGIEKDLLINPASQITPVDLSKDIYNLVVVSDSVADKDMKKTIKKVVKRSSAKRKSVKRKTSKVKKKEI